tara:strand:- start:108 stop:335 length:228 start_codon:yes stop_codon:yes gene_type:complete
MLELIDNLISDAVDMNCSQRLIDNLVISGEFDDMMKLEEEVEATKEYLAREAARKGYVNYNAIAREAARLAVKEA